MTRLSTPRGQKIEFMRRYATRMVLRFHPALKRRAKFNRRYASTTEDATEDEEISSVL